MQIKEVSSQIQSPCDLFRPYMCRHLPTKEVNVMMKFVCRGRLVSHIPYPEWLS